MKFATFEINGKGFYEGVCKTLRLNGTYGHISSRKIKVGNLTQKHRFTG